MDGETLDSEVVTALTQDADLQAEWAGYHLIRDTMRGDLPDVMHFDIASRVAEALAQEPVYIAPQAILSLSLNRKHGVITDLWQNCARGPVS